MKKWNKVLSVFLIAIVISCGVALVAGCDSCVEDLHEHTYSSVWSKDKIGHWHDYSCGHGRSETFPHSDKDGDGICDVCEWIIVPPATIEKVTVTFITGEGASAVESVELDKGSKVFKPNDPAKCDYIFDGWFTDRDCTVAFDFEKAIDTDKTLYAKWRPATIFDKLSAREDNIISEDFHDKAADGIPVHGTAYGTAGIFVDSEGKYRVENGALILGGLDSTENIGAVVDFGIVSGTVEGYFEFTFWGEESSNGNSLNFYNQSSKVFEVVANGKSASGNFIYLINGVAVEPENAVAANKDTIYNVEFKFNLKDKKLSLKINGTVVFTDTDSNIDNVTGFTVMTSNSGKCINTVDNIAVCGNSVKLANYKANLSGMLDSKFVQMTGEGGTHKINASLVASICSAGKIELNRAVNHAAAYSAYDSAVNAMNTVVSDIQQAALNYIETKFPSANYTSNNAAYNAETEKIITETASEKLDIPDGETLKAVLAALEMLEDDETCFLNYCESERKKLLEEFNLSDYVINSVAYRDVVEDNDFEPIYGDYLSYEAAISDIDERFKIFRAALQGIKTDKDVIIDCAAEKSNEIMQYRAEEINALPDADIKDAIAAEKAEAVDNLAKGIVETEGYADTESANYYVTVIDGRIEALKISIDDKIDLVDKIIAELKFNAMADFKEFVSERLSKIKDEEFAAELSANANAPALDVTFCVTVEEITETLNSAKIEYGEWLTEKIESKEYTIELSCRGAINRVKVKYGATLDVSELKDPTASNPNIMLADKNLYTDDTFEEVFYPETKIYANVMLYFKIIPAVTVEARTYNFSYSAIDKTKLADREQEDSTKIKPDTAVLYRSDFEGTPNSFLTIVNESAKLVIYRTSNCIENKDDGLSITFTSAGQVKISFSSIGGADKSRIGLKDSDDNWLVATSVGEGAKLVDNAVNFAENGSYEVTGTEPVTVIFEVVKAGTYTISCPTAELGRGARINEIVQTINAHKIPVEPVAEIPTAYRFMDVRHSVASKKVNVL